jgi:hypothetical protein
MRVALRASRSQVTKVSHLFIEHRHEEPVELWGFELRTSCMPANPKQVWTSPDDAGLAVHLRESRLEESGRRPARLHGGYQNRPQTGS